MTTDPYSALAATLSKEQIEKEVEEKIASFHGLLTREVALKLIAKERGLFKEEEQLVKIKDIKTGMRSLTVAGKILAITKETVYPSGKRARSVVITDATGHVSLMLWNNDIKIISKLKVGDEVLVKSAYENLGNLNLGYKGSLEVVNAAPYLDLADLSENLPVHVRAFISSIDGKHEYEKSNRKYTSFSFTISDSTAQKKCVLWGVPDMQKMIVGNEIMIQNGLLRDNEIHINSRTRLLVRHVTDVISGRLIDMQVKDDKLVVDIEGKILVFNRENALRFFALSVADDLSIDTIVNLKKESMLNNNVYIRCKEQEGEFIMLNR